MRVIPRILELYDSACAKQYEVVGCYIKDAGTDISSLKSLDDYVSVSIEALSDDLTISLYLSIPKVFLSETVPVANTSDDGDVLFQEDWCMELANRFLGRLKNKLVSHHCVLRMGLPKLTDEDVLSLTVEQGELYDRLFVLDSLLLGPVHNLLVLSRMHIVQKNPDLALLDYEDEDEDWFDESELEHL